MPGRQRDLVELLLRGRRCVALQQVIDGLLASLRVATITALLSVVLGTLMAFVLVRYRKFNGKTLFSGMANTPLVMPEVVLGLSLLIVFKDLFHVQGGAYWTIILGHSLLGAAYATVVISARLREMDRRIEEAAMDLGAKPWKVFFLITIPMIAPSLAAGGMMSFALSLDDLVLASFVSGPGSTTLPMEVFSAVRLGVKPEINAIASLILLSVSLFTFGSWYLMARAEKRRRAEIAMTTQMQAVA